MDKIIIRSSIFEIYRKKQKAPTINIYYKDLLLWNIIYYHKKIDFDFYFKSFEEQNKIYTLICEDNYGNTYNYGKFDSVHDINQWIEKPYHIKWI